MWQEEHRGEKTREGAKSDIGLLERMKHGGRIKDLDQAVWKSSCPNLSPKSNPLTP
jgi:hypothetical protein